MRIYYTYHGQEKIRDVDRKEILIGRLSPLSAPDIDLGEDPTVSRKHCRIKHTAGGCLIEDLRSTNGTVVEGDFVEAAPITPASMIRLGETDLRIELEPEAQPSAAAAPPGPAAKPPAARPSPLNPPASPKPSSILPPKGSKPGVVTPTAEEPPAPPAAVPKPVLPTGGPGGKPRPAAEVQKPVPKPEVKREGTPQAPVPAVKPPSRPVKPQPLTPPTAAKPAVPASSGVPKGEAAPDPAVAAKAKPPTAAAVKGGDPAKVAPLSPTAEPMPAKAAPAAADPKAESKFKRALAELFEVPLGFEANLKLEDMLKKVLAQVLKIISGAKHGAILLNDEAQKKLVVKASEPEGKVVVSDTLARRVMDEGHGFILERNLEGGSSLNPKLVKVETGMYAPLLSTEKALGAIFVDDPERSTPYGEEDMQFLLAVAHYVATIVRNHELQSGLVSNSTMLDRVVPKFPSAVQKALLGELENNQLKPAGRKDDLPVLFAELSGFHAAGSEMPVDTATEMMSDYFSALQNAIFKFDGSLDRFSGDGMVAIFGAPVEDEKRSEKAVVAAIAMRDAIRELNLKRVQNGGNIWHLKVGVNLGTVFHGFVGTSERMNFMVVGPGLRRAEGFCKGAENGEVLIGPELYQKVFKIVEAERSTVTHKDFGEFHCYRVKGLKQK